MTARQPGHVAKVAKEHTGMAGDPGDPPPPWIK
jgi:hypothetical protein